MIEEVYNKASKLKYLIHNRGMLIKDFKVNEDQKIEAFIQINSDVWRILPKPTIEQIYYLILSELEEQKEKLEKEFEDL